MEERFEARLLGSLGAIDVTFCGVTAERQQTLEKQLDLHFQRGGG